MKIFHSSGWKLNPRPGTVQRAAARGRQHPRAVHGGRALGHGHGRHRGVAHDGAVPAHARHLRQGRHAGQAGRAQRLRVPRLQDTVMSLFVYLLIISCYLIIICRESQITIISYQFYMS